jgi:hypothetical protein
LLLIDFDFDSYYSYLSAFDVAIIWLLFIENLEDDFHAAIGPSEGPRRIGPSEGPTSVFTDSILDDEDFHAAPCR